MSLLRHRAIEASAESQRSVRRPALARDRLVSVRSCCSDAELNELSLQPNVVAGSAMLQIALAAKATPTSRLSRRPCWRRLDMTAPYPPALARSAREMVRVG